MTGVHPSSWEELLWQSQPWDRMWTREVPVSFLQRSHTPFQLCDAFGSLGAPLITAENANGSQMEVENLIEWDKCLRSQVSNISCVYTDGTDTWSCFSFFTHAFTYTRLQTDALLAKAAFNSSCDEVGWISGCPLRGNTLQLAGQLGSSLSSMRWLTEHCFHGWRSFGMILLFKCVYIQKLDILGTTCIHCCRDTVSTFSCFRLLHVFMLSGANWLLAPASCAVHRHKGVISLLFLTFWKKENTFFPLNILNCPY